MNEKTLYRMLADGEQEWSGKAWDTEHAEERCFFHEEPSSLVKYTLQKWGTKKISSTMTMQDWITVYENERLK